MADSADLWPLTHRERQRFADLLAALRPDEWTTPSLAAGWTVKDVAGHCLATAQMTTPSFLLGMAGSGFRFHVMNGKNITRYGAGSPADLIARTRATADRRTAPPGPPQVPLSEVVVHSEDVARPLGRTMDRAPEALVTSLDFYRQAQPLIGGRRRAESLHLVADDVGWEHGAGPTVSGSAIDLLLALSGRRAGLDGLTGDGTATLTARMP
jgi:uncharacterized protein (TIGR03083 family)